MFHYLKQILGKRYRRKYNPGVISINFATDFSSKGGLPQKGEVKKTLKSPSIG